MSTSIKDEVQRALRPARHRGDPAARACGCGPPERDGRWAAVTP